METKQKTEQADRSLQWSRLYGAACALMARIGYEGEVCSRADEVAVLRKALDELDGGEWMPGLTPKSDLVLRALRMADMALASWENGYAFDAHGPSREAQRLITEAIATGSAA